MSLLGSAYFSINEVMEVIWLMEPLPSVAFTLPEEPICALKDGSLMRFCSWCVTRQDCWGRKTLPWKSEILEYPSAPSLPKLLSKHQLSDSRSKSTPTAVRLGSLRSHSQLHNLEKQFFQSKDLQ